MREKSYFFISGIVATTVYLVVCMATLFYIHSPKTKKFDVFNKSTVLELELISTKSNERTVAKKSIVEEPEIVKKSTSSSDKKASNLKSLFANVNTVENKIVKEEVNTVEESLDPSRFKSKFQKQKKTDNTTNVSKLLSSDKTSTNLPKNYSGAKGETHEYFSKIKEILWQRWNPKLLETGLKVRVLVMITNSGEFDYRIVKYSRDERFDQSLKEFLESQKNEQFPIHNINAKVDIIINFKSEG